MLRSLRLRLLSDIPRAPDDGGAPTTDDLTLDDPVETPVDADDDEDVTDPAGEPEELPAETPSDAAGSAPAAPAVRARANPIPTLRARAQEAERRAQEAERRAEEADRRARDYEARNRPAQIDPLAEAQMLERMSPEERVEYKVNRSLERYQAQQQVQQFQMTDRLDRQSFDTYCTTSKLALRYAGDVERELTKIRNEGGNVPRQAVLYYVLGRALAEKEGTTGGERARQGQDRIRRQTTRPTNSRGDVGGARRTGPSLEQRLENVSI